MYTYKVVSVDKVVDGDTVDLTIDLGFKLHTKQRVRVIAINTPERGEPRWEEAKLFTADWLDAGRGRLYITTTKTDSFGRYLGDIYTDVPEALTLTEALLDAGFSKYEG